MRARVLSMVTLTAAAALTLTACGPTPAASHTAPDTAVASTTPGGRPAQPVMASDSDNGHTITLTVGQHLQVVLHNTYWQFGNLSGSTLRSLAQTRQAQPPGGGSNPCVPGEGCGTVTATYSAAAAGTTTVTASRTSCGEARGCTGGQGSYRLVVIVR